MNGQTKTKSPSDSDDDDELVDLVTATLTDTNLHTDTRMRLCQEIEQLLAKTRGEVSGTAQVLPAPGQESHLPDLLRAVLVDPNLHTDLRMRLHEEIPALLHAADGGNPAAPSG